MSNEIKGLLVCCVAAAIILFPLLGQFGLWEPLETQHVETAMSLLDDEEGGFESTSLISIETRLASKLWRVFSPSEFTGRIFGAVIALFAVAAVFLCLTSMVDSRLGIYGSLVFVGAPVFVLHGRQLTGDVGLLCGEILVVFGFMAAAYVDSSFARRLGIVAGLLGCLLGTGSSGFFVGAALPAATVAFSIGLSGDLAGLFSERVTLNKLRVGIAGFTSLVAILGSVLFVAVYFFVDGDAPLITGGIAQTALKHRGFEYIFEQIVYGWYPWSALVPVAVLRFYSPRSQVDPRLVPLYAITISGLCVAVLGNVFFIPIHGDTSVFAAASMISAAAVGIYQMEKADHPLRLFAFIAVVLFIIMVRDVAQRPEVLLLGYAGDFKELPEWFKPVYFAGPAGVGAALLAVLLGLVGARRDDDRVRRWRSNVTTILLPLTSMAISGYIAFFAIPGLSLVFSSKPASDLYRLHKKGDEPLAIYGEGKFLLKAQKIVKLDKFVDWMVRDDRVMGLFEPSALADIDGKVYGSSGRRLHVLDRSLESYWLATSVPEPSEENVSPMGKTVFDSELPIEPENKFEVDFGGKAMLLGWKLRSEGGASHLVRGERFTISTYWKSIGRFRDNHRIFIHIDGPDGRIQAGHEPLEGGYSTKSWRPGQLIVDEYTSQDPLDRASGEYEISLGMYRDKKRLKVKSDVKHNKNSVPVGFIQLD